FVHPGYFNRGHYRFGGAVIGFIAAETGLSMAADLQPVFQKARSEGRIVLIGYLPAGYPTPARFLKLVETAFTSGLDILEIGLPTRHPFLDGEIIRAAMAQVNSQGVTVDDALTLGGEALAQTRSAGFAMMYADTLAGYGQEQLLLRCQQLGISGVLPLGMAEAAWQDFAARARQYQVAPIGFLTPQTDWPSQQAISRRAGGFIYLQSQAGPTGQPGEFGHEIKERIAQARSGGGPTPLPVAVGFGVHSAEDVQRIRTMGADGVIVGTTFVEAASQGRQALGQLVRRLAKAA
ncbi:MAG: tryptophan synthase subunit alpha, partial [Chloroflexota bacterium]